MTSRDRPALVLVNPSAGPARQQVDEVCQLLREHSATGIEVRSPDSGEYAATVATAVGRDVVVVGGDGSLHRLLQELSDQQLLGEVGAVGLVPMGTGNDLARGAGVPLDLDDAARTAVQGTARTRSLLVADNGQVVVNVAHCGVAAEATAHAADVKGLLGRAAYVWGAVRAGLTSEGWHLRVSVDGKAVLDGSRSVLMVSLALGSSVGGGSQIAPGAAQESGRVAVIVATGTSLRARIGFARDLRRARHLEREDVSVAHGEEVLVEAVTSRDAFRVNVDGDVADEPSLSRRWRLVEDSWRLRVPASRHPRG